MLGVLVTSPRLNGPEGPRGGVATSLRAGDGPTDDEGEREGVLPAEARLGARWVVVVEGLVVIIVLELTNCKKN